MNKLSVREFPLSVIIAVALMTAADGTWLTDIHHSWPFLLIVLITMASLGVTVLTSPRKKEIPFFIGHLGLFLILFGGFFGAPAFTEGRLPIRKDTPAHIALSEKGEMVPLPFVMSLKDFSIDYYEDGSSPKQYTSIIDIDGREFTTSVNHPCRVKGYSIYQADYDKANGQYSIVKVVRDPWLPVVLLGMAMLMISAFMGISRTWPNKGMVFIIALSVIFAIVTLARINFGTLMPALRSFWFIPHLLTYMLAYSALAISLALGIMALFKSERYLELSRKFLSTSSSLLIIGMLCGAVWAKIAWGDYWTWDAKENWAAATWLLTLFGTHLPSNSRKSTIVIVIAISFIAMQITWYGVNYLPAAASSLHTY